MTIAGTLLALSSCIRAGQQGRSEQPPTLCRSWALPGRALLGHTTCCPSPAAIRGRTPAGAQHLAASSAATPGRSVTSRPGRSSTALAPRQGLAGRSGNSPTAREAAARPAPVVLLVAAEEVGKTGAGAEAAPLAWARRFLTGVLHLQAVLKLRDPEGCLYSLLGTDMGPLEVKVGGGPRLPAEVQVVFEHGFSLEPGFGLGKPLACAGVCSCIHKKSPGCDGAASALNMCPVRRPTTRQTALLIWHLAVAEMVDKGLTARRTPMPSSEVPCSLLCAQDASFLQKEVGLC